jgi:hypothetical protein
MKSILETRPIYHKRDETIRPISGVKTLGGAAFRSGFTGQKRDFEC